MTLCSTCSRPLVPVSYGYPSPEMFEAGERGELVLGGCVVSPDAPKRACPQGCGPAANAGRPDGVREAWLLTWNPDHYSPDEDWLVAAQETTRRGGTVADDWSTGSCRRIQPGDTVYWLR